MAKLSNNLFLLKSYMHITLDVDRFLNMAKVLEISFSYPKSLMLITIDAYSSPLNSHYTIPKITILCEIPFSYLNSPY